MISTHAPLAGRDRNHKWDDATGQEISTHAPLAGRDKGIWNSIVIIAISTHAPLAGRDPIGNEI